MASAVQRRIVLGVALALTVIVIFIDSSAVEAPAIPVVNVSGQRAAPVATHAMIQPLEAEALADPFKSHGWQVDPTLAAQPLAPAPEPFQQAAPQKVAEPSHVPVLPFKYAGRFSDEGSEVVYLTRGEQTIVAKAGDLIDSDYRLTLFAADRIEFQHVPTGELQALPIPATE